MSQNLLLIWIQEICRSCCRKTIYYLLILIAKTLDGTPMMMQVEGSLTFTDNAGEGFKIFGRGTEWETIKGGKTATRAAEEAEIFKILLLQHAAAVPEGLEADLYARELAKYFPNDPPPKVGDPNADPNAPRTSVIGETSNSGPNDFR